MLSFAINAMTQVTIGSGYEPEKDTLLDLKENADGTSTKGMLLPRVALAHTNSAAPLTKHTPGMVLYNTSTTGNVTPGYYYNDGTKWVRTEAIEPWMVSGTDDKATSNSQNIYQMGNVGIGTRNPQSVFHVDGAKDNEENATEAQQANDFIITPNGNVGIGTTSPHASAALEVKASDKGFLGPKVALQSATDVTTIPDPAVGLLVYNLGTAALKTEGYLYWNGSEWLQFASGTSKDPHITSLDCANARINPISYKAGTPYNGVLIVPYTGGNGGYYPAGTPISSRGVTGLTATLQPGRLEYGNGELVFTLSGTPSASSPELSEFEIKFLDQICTAKVGANSMWQGQQTFWHGSMRANVSGDNNLASHLISDMPIVEDVFRMDAYFRSASNGEVGVVTLDPRMYNITSKPIKIWASSMSSQEGFGYSNITIPAGGYIQFDNGVYLSQGNYYNNTTPRVNHGQETVTIDLFYNGKWFRLYYTIWVDNKGTYDDTDNTRELYLSVQRLY